MHSSVHYREPKGKGHTHFYSKPKLVEARCRCGRVSYIPLLLFSYPMPVTLCYNHKNLFSTLSLLLDVVSKFALYSGVGSLSHFKRKYISIHVFLCKYSAKLSRRVRYSGYERWVISLCDVE
jgi:hypothetical protein